MLLRWWYNEKKENECSYLHDIGGDGYMDYKEKIIMLLEKVKSESTLKRVYKLLEYLYLKER